MAVRDDLPEWSENGPVAQAVLDDLDRLRQQAGAENLADSALAASALSLAKSIDHPLTSPTARSMCARELRETLDRLFEQVPTEVKKDGVDELKARRARRQALREARASD